MAIKTGIGCIISQSAFISPDADVILGDHVYIADGVRILAGKVKIGDYSKIHNNVLINPVKFVELGHLAWIGQGSILDGTGGIKAGNYLGVGMNSALYSHIRHGDIFEGSNFDSDRDLIIGDDVWFVGQCLISPITAENKSIALLGSVVTKNMEENKVYGGNPAKKLIRIGEGYRKVGMEEKEFVFHLYLNQYRDKGGDIENLKWVFNYPKIMLDHITYYNLKTRTYTKRNTENEINFNKWLFPYRAKFIPR